MVNQERTDLMLLRGLRCKMSTVWNDIAHITPHVILTAIKGDGISVTVSSLWGQAVESHIVVYPTWNWKLKVLKERCTQRWNLR